MRGRPSRAAGILRAKRQLGAADVMFWTSEFFWNVFQRTGAAWAYVVYRRLRRAHAYARFIWN